MPKTPTYRIRPGYTQAIVTLADSVTKKRRDFRLGFFETNESREQLRSSAGNAAITERCVPSAWGYRNAKWRIW